jgi:hypothetical protein
LILHNKIFTRLCLLNLFINSIKDNENRNIYETNRIK